MLQNKSRFTKFMTVFGFFMAATYIVLGITLLLTNYFPDIPKNIKFVFAFFFIAYGLFRFVRIWTKANEPNE
jgi:prolipoprotein diacylglyceryltransferase